MNRMGTEPVITDKVEQTILSVIVLTCLRSDMTNQSLTIV